MALERGTRFGPYEIGDSVGVGGMGEVYRARDTSLDRQVAIKVLPETFAADADRISRFEKEAKTLAALNHPNIAQIYGLERSGATTALVMELVEGQTLGERLEQGALPVNEAMSVAMQIVEALEAAHGQGIVHRDLKPANIKLAPNGVVKILDFGIAKSLEFTAASGGRGAVYATPSVTQTGVILGTAAYMSPEPARGKAVDIWAFGVVLYEMLTGQSAFGGEDVTVTLARVLERSTDMSTLPNAISPAVRQTLQLCLQKNVRKRIADIRDVRLALEGEFEETTSVPARPPLMRRALPVAAGLVVGGIVIGGLVYALRAPEPPVKPVTRLLVTPAPDAPLSQIGGYDVMISPDGSKLVYYAQVDLNRRVALWLRDLDSLEPRRLPGTEVATTGGNMLPFFSPDGANVGFRSPGQGLMRIALAGGPPINVLPDDVIEQPQYLGSAWASDGTLIFSTGGGLFRVSAGGGGIPVALTEPPESPATRYIAPVLLPGEHAVLYTIDDARIMALDLDTLEEHVLIEVGKNPFYSPSGHLVFARGSTLMAVPFDVATLTVKGDPVALLEGIRYPGGGTATDLALSASGTLVYVPGGETDSLIGEIVWVGAEGLPLGPAFADRIENPRSLRLSPDGTRVAVATGSFTDGDIWVYDLGGRPPIPLATAGDNVLPVWSPDGTQIAFTSNVNGQYGIYVAPSDGSLTSFGDPLPDSTNMAATDWRDDQTLIAVASSGSGDIVSMDLEQRSEWHQIAASGDAEFDASVSPDGRWLAYVSTRTATPEIWVRAYPDGVPVRVSRNGGVEPRWSADGSKLYFFQGTSMNVVNVSPGPQFAFDAAVAVFSGAYSFSPQPTLGSYDVAADGRFLMTRDEATAAGRALVSDSIVVVQNFDEELRRRVPVP